MYCIKRKCRSNLKLTLESFFILNLCFLTADCTEPEHLPTPPLLLPTILYGQVYNLSHPGPIPVDWIPPPYKHVCTVIAGNVNQNIKVEVESDSLGKFQIKVSPGTYYLRVKESPLSSVTGPYHVKYGEMLETKAYFDNGMR